MPSLALQLAGLNRNDMRLIFRHEVDSHFFMECDETESLNHGDRNVPQQKLPMILITPWTKPDFEWLQELQWFPQNFKEFLFSRLRYHICCLLCFRRFFSKAPVTISGGNLAASVNLFQNKSNSKFLELYCFLSIEPGDYSKYKNFALQHLRRCPQAAI